MPRQSNSKFFSALPGRLLKVSQFSGGIAVPLSSTSLVLAVGVVMCRIHFDPRALIEHDLEERRDVDLVRRENDLGVLHLHADVVEKLLEFSRSNRRHVQLA